MAGRTFTDDDFADAAPSPAGKRTFTDDDFADEPAPRAPPADSGVGRGVETAVVHAGRGLAGDWPARAAAAISATAGVGPEETWGQRYDAAMGASTRAADKMAEERPVLAGTAELAGAVTPYLAGGGFIKGGASLMGQAARAAGIGGLHGSLTGGLEGAAQEAAFGAVIPGMGAAKTVAQKAAALGLPAALSAPTLVDADASAKDKVVAFESAVLPVAGHVAGSRGRAVPELERSADRARAQVEPVVRETLGKEAEAVEQQRAEIDRQNIARTDAARTAEEQVVGQIGSVNADINDSARGIAAQDAKAARGETQDALNKRAVAFDERSIKARDEAAAKKARDVKENTGRRISGAEHAIEMIDAQADYAKKMEAFNRAAAKAKDAASRAKVEADRTVAVQEEHAKATRAHEKALKDAAAELADLEAEAAGGARSGNAAWAKLHQDAQAWITGYEAVHELAGQKPDPALMARAKKIAGQLADTRSEWGEGRVKEFEDKFGKGREKFVEEFAADQTGDIESRKAAVQSRVQEMQAPTVEDSAKRVADRAVMPEAERAARVNAAEAAGLDATNASDANLRAMRLPPKGGALPESVKPDDSGFRRGVQEMLLKKLKAPPEKVAQKPPAIEKRMDDRIDRNELRRRLEEIAARTGRQAQAIEQKDRMPDYENVRGAWRSDPSLLLEKPDPMHVTDDLVRQRVDNEIAAGRRNVRESLTMEGVPEDRTIANERIRERLARLIPDVPIGHGLRRVLSTAVGKEGGALEQYTRPERGSGTSKASGYKTPAEAAGIFADEAAGIGPTARMLASPEARFAGAAAGVGSARELLDDPGFAERVRAKAEEKKASASTPTAPSLAGNGGLGGSLVNPRIGLEIQRLLKDPATRAQGEELLRRAKLGMSMSTPVIP